MTLLPMARSAQEDVPELGLAVADGWHQGCSPKGSWGSYFAPLGSSLDRKSATGNATALVPGPLARLQEL